MDNDKILYENFLNGNKEAFDILMDKYRLNLIYFINRFLNDVEASEDLAQDVFVYILINRKEYDFKYSMKTYLYTIAKSRTLNYLERRKKIVPIDDNYISNIEDTYLEEAEEAIYAEGRNKELYNAMKNLNRSQQIVIYLADIEELSYKDISKILGKSVPQVKMTLYRARKKLKAILKKGEDKNE